MKKDFTQEMQALQTSTKLVMMQLKQSNLGRHDHHFFELAYVTSGTCKHTLNGTAGRLQAGDYFFIDYGSIHSYEQVQDLELINCLFLPEFIDETLQGCKSLNELLHTCLLRYHRMIIGENWADRIFHDEDGTVGRLLSDMVQEYRHQTLGSEDIFRCKLTEILILTLRMLIKPQRPVSDSAIIGEVIHFVDKHYREPLTLQTFCEQKHYNVSYISRRFKQDTGMSFREYVQKVRMERCCELLAGSDTPVSEIARSVGYEDVQFFNTVFKKLLHMTPREYRKRRR